MKIAYIGSSQFSANLLNKLIDIQDELGFHIDLIITQEDQPVGRKKIVTPTPVKLAGQENKINVSFNLKDLETTKPDIVILFAYGEIIPQWALDIPKHGFWNIHPSLLPAYRGASPTVYPLLLGDVETGTTIMQMDKELDHGNVLAQEKLIIEKNDTNIVLLNKLTDLSFTLLKKLLIKLTSEPELQQTLQDHSKATYTRPLTKKDGYIPFDVIRACFELKQLSYEELPEILKDWYTRNKKTPDLTYNSYSIVKNMYKALKGWPDIWTLVKVNKIDKRLKIIEIDLVSDTFKINKVQLEGKNIVDFSTFSSAYRIFSF